MQRREHAHGTLSVKNLKPHARVLCYCLWFSTLGNMKAQCCICADLFVNSEANIAATTCGHVFHEDCLARWLITASTCPSCRMHVKQNAVIPKLFFDFVDDEPEDVDPEKLANELQILRAQLREEDQKKTKHKNKNKILKKELKEKEEELENVRKALLQEKDRLAAQQRLLQQYEMQQKVHKEEKEEFIRSHKKLSELKQVETLVMGGIQESDEILRQYSSGDRSGLSQLAKYAAILKREYEQVKMEKKVLKEQLDKLKKSGYTTAQELAHLKTSNQLLQEQLMRSEEDLKQAEKTNVSRKLKICELKYGWKHARESSSENFLETSERQGISDNILVKKPKLSAGNEIMMDLSITPRMTPPSGCELIDLESSTDVNQSIDLFEESPGTQVRKACEENKVKLVKISSASSAAKPEWTEMKKSVGSFPLSALNIMKKREKTRHFLCKTMIRKDYNGLGSTSKFTQSLSLPKCTSKRGAKKARHGNKSTDPPLPTLQDFIDLT